MLKLQQVHTNVPQSCAFVVHVSFPNVILLIKKKKDTKNMLVR
jgi:hypothetical protein